MNITDIVRKIENPNLCTTSDVKDFEGLIEKYPYAQSFPILLLKTLGQAKDIHFEDSLNQHAYRISDRMHLYFLINDVEEVSSSELQEEEEEEEDEEEGVANSKLQVASSVDKEGDLENVASKTVEKVVEVVNSELQVTGSADKEEDFENVASKTVEKVVEVVNSELQVTSFAADDDIVRLDYEKLLEQDIKFEKVEEMTFEPVRIHIDDDGEVSSSELQVPSSEELETIEEFFEADEIPAITLEEEIEAESADVEVSAKDLQEANREITEVKDFEEAEPETENVSIEFFDPTQEMEISNAVEDISVLEPSSFEEQHKVISLDFIEKKFNQEEDELTSNAISQGFQLTLDKEEKVAIADEKPKVANSDVTESIAKFEQNTSDEKRSFYAWLHANEESSFVEKNDRSTEIMEKFIQEEPKISRLVKEDEEIEKKKTPFFKATEIAKESLKEKSIPVSVTLAQIFESQGNFPKAIDSYEQLMLLYPEKKTFFANQIKKLKKKLNN